MSDRNTRKESNLHGEQEVSERQHPYKTYLFFSLIGSSVLFLSLVFMYVIWFNHNNGSIKFVMPKPFIVSTIIMLISSYSLTHSLKAFKDDQPKIFLLSLSTTLLLGISFAILQVYGWIQLYDSGNFIDGNIGCAFIFVITGLHFLHVVVGLFFLFYLSLKAFDNWNDPIKSLVFFSNKYEFVRIDLFNSYWHFIDAMWIVLFFTFLFTL